MVEAAVRLSQDSTMLMGRKPILKDGQYMVACGCSAEFFFFNHEMPISSIFVWRENWDSRVKVKLKEVKIIHVISQLVHADETKWLLTKHDALVMVFQVQWIRSMI